jgi:hypothetical protein
MPVTMVLSLGSDGGGLSYPAHVFAILYRGRLRFLHLEWMSTKAWCERVLPCILGLYKPWWWGVYGPGVCGLLSPNKREQIPSVWCNCLWRHTKLAAGRLREDIHLRLIGPSPRASLEVPVQLLGAPHLHSSDRWSNNGSLSYGSLGCL